MPPEALAVQVALLPLVMLVGETEQEPVMGGMTVTVVWDVAEPVAFVQVSLYVVVEVGDTLFVPLGGVTDPTL